MTFGRVFLLVVGLLASLATSAQVDVDSKVTFDELIDSKAQRRLLSWPGSGEPMDLETRCQLEQDNVGHLEKTLTLLEKRNMSSVLVTEFVREYETLVAQVCGQIYTRRFANLTKQLDEHSIRSLNYHISLMNDFHSPPKRLVDVSCDFDEVTDALDSAMLRTYSKHPTSLSSAKYYDFGVKRLMDECDRLINVLGDVADKRIKYSHEKEDLESIRWALRYKFCLILNNNNKEENFGQLIDNKWSQVGSGGEKLLEIFNYLPSGTDPGAQHKFWPNSNHSSSLVGTFDKSPTRQDYIRAFEKLARSSGNSRRLCITRKKLLVAEVCRLAGVCSKILDTYRGHLWLQSVGYGANIFATLTERRNKILRLAQVCKSVASIDLATEISH